MSMIYDHVAVSGVEYAPVLKGTSELGSKALGVCRLDPPAQIIRTFETANAHFVLLRLTKHNSAEMEFSTPSHLAILLTNGISRGCEWSDGRQTRRISSLAPNTVIVNPAQNYLRIRTSISQNHFQMLVLAIQPTLMSWRNDLEIDLASVQLYQKVGLDDDDVCQTLISMRQEIETPGINSAFYVDTLLFLLLTRLMRCASDLAEPRQRSCVKGGLPNWRLKRAIERLEGDPAKMPTLAEVAELIGLHPATFCRSFKQSMGLSPHRYLLAHRVNRAKEMMNNQKLSLTEIALDCGFGSSSQFSVVFKKITGMSPREFRRGL